MNFQENYCNIIIIIHGFVNDALCIELGNFAPRDSDSSHNSLDSDSKPAGLGLESDTVRLGLDSRPAGLEKTWTRCNSVKIACIFATTVFHL